MSEYTTKQMFQEIAKNLDLVFKDESDSNEEKYVLSDSSMGLKFYFEIHDYSGKGKYKFDVDHTINILWRISGSTSLSKYWEPQTLTSFGTYNPTQLGEKAKREIILRLADRRNWR